MEKEKQHRLRVMMLSCAVILLCITIVIGMTVALFTDGDKVHNHLQAGDLEVLLTRTHLEYSTLNGDGELVTTVVEEDHDFTSSTEENVFGLDAAEVRIVPQSYFKADMKVTNLGNVAFTYGVSIQLTGNSNALAEQLQVTVTRADGSTVTHKLSEMLEGVKVVTGLMLAGDAEQTFTVEVTFIDDTAINDAAQTQVAAFDLVILAVQATNQ